MKRVFILVVVACGLFVRMFNLERSSHFLFDESRDLVNMHQIWVEKKLTLVGPISEDRSHVNGSLTYYMLLPFAAAANFDPIGPALGAVFWGIATWAMMYLTVRIYSPKMAWPALVLGAVWFPFVETARWAWNPNLMMFWIFCGMCLSKNSKWWMQLAGGLTLGLAVHHHNLALVPLGLWVIYKRDLRMICGILIAVIPFFLFDLKNPPGIFVSRMVEYNRGTVGQNPLTALANAPQTFIYFFEYIVRIKQLLPLAIITATMIAIWDIMSRNKAIYWLIMWGMILLPTAWISKQWHYFLPAIPFFLIWLFYQRNNAGRKLAMGFIGLLLLGSVLTVSQLWNQPDWQGDLRLVKEITNILAGQIKKQHLLNPNIAVLGSPEIYTSGSKYRNMLLLHDIHLRSYEEYGLSDNLFVVTSSSADELRRDPATEMLYFKNGPVAGVWTVHNSNWKVVQFNRY